MVIKIIDLIKVADNRGPDMDQAETVTYFNDLCIFAPSALLEADMVWEEVDENSVKGTFTNEGISVSEILIAMILKTCEIIGVMIVMQTVFQYFAGIELPLPVMITKAGIFVILAAFSLYFEVKLYRHIKG